jgi:hypothetical protein
MHNGDQLLFIHDLAHKMDASISTIGLTYTNQKYNYSLHNNNNLLHSGFGFYFSQ